MDWASLIVGAILGGLASWVITLYFAKKGSDEARVLAERQVEQQRRAMVGVAGMVGDLFTILLNREGATYTVEPLLDEDGNPAGAKVSVNVTPPPAEVVTTVDVAAVKITPPA